MKVFNILAVVSLAILIAITCHYAVGQTSSHPRWHTVKQLPEHRWKEIKLDLDPTEPGNVLRPPVLTGIFFLNDNSGWAVGEGGVIVKTHDGGKTWKTNALTPKTYLYDVFFANEQFGWAVGRLDEENQGAVFETEDGGANWILEKTFDGFDLGSMNGVWFSDQLHGWVAGTVEKDGTDYGIIFETDDGGHHWIEQYNRESKNGLYKVRFMDRARGWALARDAVLRTTDGGQHWEDQYRSNGNRNDFFFGLAFVTVSEGWLVGGMYEGTILHTIDAGDHWQRIPLPQKQQIPRKVDTLFYYSVDFAAPSRGWVGANGGLVFSTTDGGKSWIAEPTNSRGAIASLARTSRHVFAATSDGSILERSSVP